MPERHVARTSRSVLAIASLLLLVCLAVSAQSTQTIKPQQCVWHAGDNPAWAAPDLDETGWQPYTEWKIDFQQARLWIRCTAEPSALRRLPKSAIQISVPAAYELYLDGRRVGGVGNMQSGNFSMDRTRSWPLPPGPLGSPEVIALRLAYRSPLAKGPATIQLGSRDELKTSRDSTVLAMVGNDAGMAVCYIVIAAVGLGLLGLFLSDRSRTEILFLALTCLALATLRLIVFAVRVQAGISAETAGFVFEAFDIFVPLTEALFFFRLARRRMPGVIVVALSIITLWAALAAFSTVAPFSIAVRLAGMLLGPYGYTLMLVCSIVAILGSALLAFLPLRSIPSGTRLLGALCCLWALTDAVWFGFEIPTAFPGLPNLWLRWYTELANIRGLAMLAIVVALMALLLREQRRVVEERAELAGEMHAARTIQTILAPASLESIPGIRIGAAFRPMRDVGGDFYLCRVLPDGRQRILLGDVSGKGTAAAMTSTLLIGAAEHRHADSPSSLLNHLNIVLRSSQVGGFATCLCADITAEGAITLANAGHLAPYRNGEEVQMPGSLPLGVAPTADVPEIALELAPGDQFVFLSDGVVEAQSPNGELFGFDRTRQISTHPAEAIAQAAQQFGQEDDITVLTVQFQGKPQPAASSIGLELEGLTAEG